MLRFSSFLFSHFSRTSRGSNLFFSCLSPPFLDGLLMMICYVAASVVTRVVWFANMVFPSAVSASERMPKKLASTRFVCCCNVLEWVFASFFSFTIHDVKRFRFWLFVCLWLFPSPDSVNGCIYVCLSSRIIMEPIFLEGWEKADFFFLSLSFFSSAAIFSLRFSFSSPRSLSVVVMSRVFHVWRDGNDWSHVEKRCMMQRFSFASQLFSLYLSSKFSSSWLYCASYVWEMKKMLLFLL